MNGLNGQKEARLRQTDSEPVRFLTDHEHTAGHFQTQSSGLFLLTRLSFASAAVAGPCESPFVSRIGMEMELCCVGGQPPEIAGTHWRQAAHPAGGGRQNPWPSLVHH